MYSLKASASFDSAHFLYGYNGKCSNIHGHRWLIEAVVSGGSLSEEGDKRGMLLDFCELKDAVKRLADEYDHTLIFETGSLKPETLATLRAEGFFLTEVGFRPTAENLAREFFGVLKGEGLPVKSVAVHETPDNIAVYEE